jgi:hypothetical protein
VQRQQTAHATHHDTSLFFGDLTLPSHTTLSYRGSQWSHSNNINIHHCNTTSTNCIPTMSNTQADPTYSKEETAFFKAVTPSILATALFRGTPVPPSSGPGPKDYTALTNNEWLSAANRVIAVFLVYKLEVCKPTAKKFTTSATVSAVLSSESLGSRHRHPSWIRLVVVCWSDERQFGALADSSNSSSASGANR